MALKVNRGRPKSRGAIKAKFKKKYGADWFTQPGVMKEYKAAVKGHLDKKWSRPAKKSSSKRSPSSSIKGAGRFGKMSFGELGAELRRYGYKGKLTSPKLKTAEQRIAKLKAMVAKGASAKLFEGVRIAKGSQSRKASKGSSKKSLRKDLRAKYRSKHGDQWSQSKKLMDQFKAELKSMR